MKLTDTMLVILTNASQSFDGNVLPLPGSLRGGAQTKVIDALLRRGLIEERTVDRLQPAVAGLNRIWREDDDGRAILLYITKDGLAAIGIEPEDADEPDAETAPSAAPELATGARKSKGAPKPRASRKAATAAPRATDGATRRAGTKQDALIAMLRRPEGASISEISDAFGWLPHTVRGAISGALRKKLKLEVQCEKIDVRGTVYRLPN